MTMMIIGIIAVIYFDLILLANEIFYTAFGDKRRTLLTVHNKDIISGRSGTVGLCAGL